MTAKLVILHWKLLIQWPPIQNGVHNASIRYLKRAGRNGIESCTSIL